jgi:hypothetical protein
MKKINLLSKAEMKNVKGGLNKLICEYYIVCGVTSEGPEIPYPNQCCNGLSQAETYCRGLGYTGVYGCIYGGIEEV